ncbi:cupin domain-containing protein [Phaeodactylibacter luteus]|uniref:hypothetical protein n=1 Tax=Phaeodactylibacter luteus TaxID=1564516 RepID=UPI0014781B82|nr:hypothetical protein [Phaeodactylibacter luteus]
MKYLILIFITALGISNSLAQSSPLPDDGTTTSAMQNLSLQGLHSPEKPISARPLFTGAKGTTTALQILKGGQLKSHTSDVKALLICLSGQVSYGTSQGETQTLSPGGYLFIEPQVEHWVDGLEDSQLLLIK